ncbi:hypothetical protein CFK37_08095 [Virgibacillus phasianinus]|uniref:DUF2935 domain-containing protein n=1 Tax=Virgibacillus phasianinus TaxID=2017483 RepID=A0A220U227_9BACI|nr:DUF2935 domain-containing protein [Virgibacillus phasianinus]ASK62127.1 hypothetical protein CFK37_08095 [Virgibacillus phasianinus]
MQFYYGNQWPLRVLDEAEFWKEQEAEHTVVIRELLPDLEQEFVDGLNRWEDVLKTTKQHVTRFIESVIRSKNHISPQLSQQVLDLASFCLQESVAFIQFCRKIKTESKSVVGNPMAKTVMDHIIDESEYFIGIAQTILYEQ